MLQYAHQVSYTHEEKKYEYVRHAVVYRECARTACEYDHRIEYFHRDKGNILGSAYQYPSDYEQYECTDQQGEEDPIDDISCVPENRRTGNYSLNGDMNPSSWTKNQFGGFLYED